MIQTIYYVSSITISAIVLIAFISNYNKIIGRYDRRRSRLDRLEDQLQEIKENHIYLANRLDDIIKDLNKKPVGRRK